VNLGFNAVEPPRVVTLAQLAALYQVTRRTVDNWLASGKLNAERGLLALPNGRWRVDIDVFHASLRAPAKPTTKPSRRDLRLIKSEVQS
jgi:hypothetical protein